MNALQVPVWFYLWFMFQYDKCLVCFEKSLKVNALQVPVWFTYGCAAMAAQDYKLAVKAFKRCVSIDYDVSTAT